MTRVLIRGRQEDFPFSSCLQSFLASGSFPMSQLFASGGQSIGASASVLPVNIHGWFSLGLTCLFSLLSKGLWRVFSNTTVWKHQFFSTPPSLWSNSHIHTWPLEKPCFDYTDLIGKMVSLHFNMLSRLVIAFLPLTSCFNLMAVKQRHNQKRDWRMLHSWLCRRNCDPQSVQAVSRH